jgi:hypothetical protein
MELFAISTAQSLSWQLKMVVEPSLLRNLLGVPYPLVGKVLKSVGADK